MLLLLFLSFFPPKYSWEGMQIIQWSTALGIRSSILVSSSNLYCNMELVLCHFLHIIYNFGKGLSSTSCIFTLKHHKVLI